jgi:hypothetical protein
VTDDSARGHVDDRLEVHLQTVTGLQQLADPGRSALPSHQRRAFHSPPLLQLDGAGPGDAPRSVTNHSRVGQQWQCGSCERFGEALACVREVEAERERSETYGYVD